MKTKRYNMVYGWIKGIWKKTRSDSVAKRVMEGERYVETINKEIGGKSKWKFYSKLITTADDTNARIKTIIGVSIKTKNSVI